MALVTSGTGRLCCLPAPHSCGWVNVNTAAAATVTELSDWPKTLAEQAQAVQKIIQQ